MDAHTRLMIAVRVLVPTAKARIQGDNPPVITEWKHPTIAQPSQAEFDAVTDEQIEEWLDNKHRAAWEQARARRNTYTPRR